MRTRKPGDFALVTAPRAFLRDRPEEGAGQTDEVISGWAVVLAGVPSSPAVFSEHPVSPVAVRASRMARRRLIIFRFMAVLVPFGQKE